MGLPAAAFASAGIPEAVIDRQTGLLADERDVLGLANNILRIVTDHELWRRFSRGGIRRVHELFDLQKQTRILENIYCEILEKYSKSAESRKDL